jgi:hypothetical protein
MRGLHQRAVSRTESFSRRVKGNWDERSGAEKLFNAWDCPLHAAIEVTTSPAIL